MAKTFTNVSAVAEKPANAPKTEAVVQPSKPQEEAPAPAPMKAEDRPLVSKAVKMLKALSGGKAMSSKELQVATKLSSSDLSSYMGSTGDAKRYGAEWEGKPIYQYWDKIARSPQRNDWNHLSLLGRGFVEYKKPEGGGKGMFVITKQGEDALKKVEDEAEKAKDNGKK